MESGLCDHLSVFFGGGVLTIIRVIAGFVRIKYVALALRVPFAVLVGGYVDAVLFGIFRYDLYVKASLAATVCGTAATIALIAWLGLPGAFWGICAMSVLQALCDVIALSRAQGFRQMFQLGFDWCEARALGKICVVM